MKRDFSRAPRSLASESAPIAGPGVLPILALDAPRPPGRALTWGDVSPRERALLRALLDLDDVMNVTGSDTPENRAWYDWAEQAHTHVRAWLVGRGFPV